MNAKYNAHWDSRSAVSFLHQDLEILLPKAFLRRNIHEGKHNA